MAFSIIFWIFVKACFCFSILTLYVSSFPCGPPILLRLDNTEDPRDYRVLDSSDVVVLFLFIMFPRFLNSFRSCSLFLIMTS